MRILIATDGSDVAVHAAQRGIDVLGAATEIVLVCVLTSIPGDEAGGFEGPLETPEEMELEWEQERSDAEAALERTAGALHASAPVQRRIEIGDAGAAIVAVAEESDVDVVVIGSHGRGLLGRIVHLGSVSDHVVRHAPCPVLVVRAAAVAEAAEG
jgi:nucleotide-binding universal stress UspA family protein